MAGTADASGDRAVAAGGNIGRVVTGDFSTQVEHGVLLPAAPVPVPDTGLVHLPERTALFVGRQRELGLLDAGAPSGVQVLCGLGGIGKSTLAAHWAAGRITGHNPVWWITAETPAELDAGLAALARAMQPAYVGVLPDDALRERALQWLAAHDGWLLVLDNVSDPADLKPFLARATGGRILITSRRASGWQDLAETIAVPELGPEESAALFERVCPGDGVPEVCAELGHLPLALRQAAAYCAEADITPRAYLDLLARYPAETFALTAEGGEAARTMARVWQVTLDRLADTPRAVKVLRVIAWWAPEGIPRRLLEPMGTQLEIMEALRRLAAHSMITLSGGALTVHRLVQAVVRAEPQGTTARDIATRLLWLDLADTASGWDRRQAVVHAEALAAHTDPAEDDRFAAELFRMAGGFFGRDTATNRALPLLERALRSLRRVHGPEHPLVLSTTQALALTLDMAGESLRAAELLTEVVAHRTRLLGPDDPQTRMTRRQLAEVLRASEPEEAGRVLREHAEECHRVLGPAHPETIEARYALIKGQHADVAALEELVADAERADPVDLLLCEEVKRSLVLVLSVKGESKRALALATEAAEESRRRHGTEDSRTLLARLVLLHVLRAGGPTDRARSMGAELLADCLRVVGEGELTRIARRLQP
ncbi:tetratricopeptide repeat protein [Streptomyces exfoliatus]|uniref:tetratricopeptide repeat protein n=1 Tax=Streptomyces exfoliatus TaxID=1905 RepID=UPI003C2AE630